MICMIGKDTRRRAFAALIAAAAGLIALVFILGTAITGLLLLSVGSGGEDELHSEADAEVMKNGGVSLYDPARDGDVMRLHIVANSDSEEDQRVKLLVRDEVLSLANLSDDILHPKSLASAERILKSAGQPLLNAVRAVLKREGVNYDAQLMIGDFDFPDREYGGKLYPAGKYRALRILLGGAEGKNWWCILFPPLCIIRTEEQVRVFEAEQSVSAADSGESVKAEGEAQDEPIRFESLIVRLFNKLFCGEER